MTTADKKQLYKDAEVYARQLGIDIDKEFRSDVELAYVDGATAEHERAQQELQAYRDMIKELLPIAEKMRWALEDHIEPHEEDFIRFIEAINKAKTIKNKT